MLRLFLLLFLNIAPFWVVRAQVGVFFQTYDYGNINNTVSSLVEYQGDLYLTESLSGSDSATSRIIRVDGQSGQVQWSKVFGTYDNLIRTNDITGFNQSLFVAGLINDSTKSYPVLYLMQLATVSGNLQYSQATKIAFNDHGERVIPHGDDIVIAGRTHDSTLQYSDIFLTKVDTHGNPSFKTIHNYGVYEDVATIDISSDGGYILGGHWWNSSSFSLSQDCYLLKTDSEGKPIWRKGYETNNEEWFMHSITTDDGGFAIAGYRKVNDKYHGLLIKTDDQGNFQWERQFDNIAKSSVFRRIAADEDGNLLLAGDRWDPATPSKTNIWLVKTNLQGDTLWTRQYLYHDDTLDHVPLTLEMIATSDGGYALAGRVANTALTGLDTWILKVDSLGRTCDDPPCQGILTGTTIALEEKPRITIYPNPSSGTIHIGSRNSPNQQSIISFFDLRGKLMEEVELETGITNYILSLPFLSGLYTYRIIVDGVMSQIGKIALVR